MICCSETPAGVSEQLFHGKERKGERQRYPFRLAASRQATFPKGTAFVVAGDFPALPKAVPLGKVAANAVSRRKGCLPGEDVPEAILNRFTRKQAFSALANLAKNACN